MPVTGEVEIDLSVNQNPFVHPDINWIHQQGAVIDNAWRDNVNGGGPCKNYWTGEIDRTQTVIVKATVKEGGIIWGGDCCGIGFMNSSGQGYALRISGTEFRLYKMTSSSSYGTAVTYESISAGDIPDGVDIEVHLTPDNKISTYIGGVRKLNGYQAVDYVNDLQPGMVVEWLNDNMRGMSALAIDGIAASVVAPSWNGVPNPPPAVMGEQYNYEFGHLIDGDEPFTITNIGDFGPDGWAITGTSFGGIATNHGDFTNINLRADNDSGIPADSGPFVITVNEPVEAPGWLADPAPPNAVVGEAYSYSFAHLITGDEPIAVASIGSALPPGLSIVDRTIAGMPSAAGVTNDLQLSLLGQAPPVADSGLFAMTVEAASIPGPKITGVNGDNSIISTQPGTIQGSELTETSSVAIGGVPFAFTVTSDALVTYGALDIHDTALGLGLAELVLTTNVGSVSFDVLVRPQPGSTYVVATRIDYDPPGLLAVVTNPAEVGDIYEGWEEQPGLGVPLTYRAAGPHRANVPPMPDNTLTIGWFYDVSLRQWEDIRETTRQSDQVAPVISNPRHDTPVAHDEIVGWFDTTSATGTSYALATLTPVEPSVEDIVNGNGEASDSRVADVQAGEGPFVLAGLNGYTRYYYWFVQDADNNGNYSNIIGGSALTAEEPVGPPSAATLLNPFHGVVGPDFGTCGVTSTSDRGMLYFVATKDPEEPPPENIHHGIGVEAHSSAIPVVGVNGPFLLGGLDRTQLYYYWFVQDVNANLGETQ